MRHALPEALALIRLAHGDRRACWRRQRSAVCTRRARCRPCSVSRPTPAPRRPSGRPPRAPSADRALGYADRRRWRRSSRAPRSRSILLLMSLGLAIVFGLMGVINMAHGELMVLGAYTTYVVQNCSARAWPEEFDAYFLAGAARVVPRGGGRRPGARARRHPSALRPAAGDAAADVGRVADHPAGPAPLVRRRERGRALAARGSPAACP